MSTTDELGRLIGVAEAGMGILRRRRSTRRAQSARTKRDGSLVCASDLKANEAILRASGSLFPGVPVHSEEGPYSDHLGQGPVLVVDPLDGTTNYTRGIDLCSTSVALLEDGTPRLAVVACLDGRIYYALRGHGSYCLRHGMPDKPPLRLRCRRRPLSSAVLAVSTDQNHQTAREIWWSWLQRLRPPTCYRIRIVESAALELCWLAEGAIDGYLHPSDQPWDVAAGALIAQEAGAVVRDPGFDMWHAVGRGIVAISPNLLRPITALLHATST